MLRSQDPVKLDEVASCGVSVALISAEALPAYSPYFVLSCTVTSVLPEFIARNSIPFASGGQKNLHIVQFIGAPPSEGPGIWGMLMISGAFFKTKRFADL